MEEQSDLETYRKVYRFWQIQDKADDFMTYFTDVAGNPAKINERANELAAEEFAPEPTDIHRPAGLLLAMDRAIFNAFTYLDIPEKKKELIDELVKMRSIYRYTDNLLRSMGTDYATECIDGAVETFGVSRLLTPSELDQVLIKKYADSSEEDLLHVPAIVVSHQDKTDYLSSMIRWIMEFHEYGASLTTPKKIAFAVNKDAFQDNLPPSELKGFLDDYFGPEQIERYAMILTSNKEVHRYLIARFQINRMGRSMEAHPEAEFSVEVYDKR
ncbi:MAG: hypothetical protein GXP63_01905 [DPANN group archaeon]|nr:hypothetical protein [DPANN group archaeon]